jgi:cobalamin synthase
MVPAMRYPYARQGEGTGSPYAGQVGKEHIMFSVLLALAVSALIMRTEGVVLVMGAWLVSAVTTWWLAKRLGGMTGDTYGFINEVAEISFLLLALMV